MAWQDTSRSRWSHEGSRYGQTETVDRGISAEDWWPVMSGDEARHIEFDALLTRVTRVESIVDERQRFYGVRYDALEAHMVASFSALEKQLVAAMVSLDRQMVSAFAASDRAITKAEEAQREYNVRSNEFRGQLDDQAKLLMPRIEAQASYRSMDEKFLTMHGGLDARISNAVTISIKTTDDLKKEIAQLREKGSNLDGRMVMLGIAGMALVAVIVAWAASAIRGMEKPAPAPVTLTVPAPGGNVR